MNDVTREQATLMAQALFELSAVDGHSEREGLLLKAFWMELVGGDESQMLDLKALESSTAVTGQMLAAALPEKALRSVFLETAIRLAYADGKVTKEEQSWIVRIAKDLGFAEQDVLRMEDGVRSAMLRELSHVQNTDALRVVAKELGF